LQGKPLAASPAAATSRLPYRRGRPLDLLGEQALADLAVPDEHIRQQATQHVQAGIQPQRRLHHHPRLDDALRPRWWTRTAVWGICDGCARDRDPLDPEDFADGGGWRAIVPGSSEAAGQHEVFSWACCLSRIRVPPPCSVQEARLVRAAWAAGCSAPDTQPLSADRHGPARWVLHL